MTNQRNRDFSTIWELISGNDILQYLLYTIPYREANLISNELVEPSRWKYVENMA